MASLATTSDFQTRFYIHLDRASTQAETDFEPLLTALIPQSRAHCAAIYRFDHGKNEFSAAAARSLAQPLIGDTGLTLTSAVSAWLFKLAEPAQGHPATDERFERFPECLQFGVETILIVPLRGAERLLGILTLGRTTLETFDPETRQLAQRGARLIAAVIERDELQNRLRERKVVERAKGILQRRNGLSEERAYILLRNTSRQRRMPMFEIASEIVGRTLRVQAAL